MIIHDVETGSLDWHRLHLGIPSAGNFSRLITPGGKPANNDGMRSYLYELLGQRFTGRLGGSISHLPAVQRGLLLEPQSIARHEMLHGVEVRPVGFVTDDLRRWGATPDGGIYEDGRLVRVLEAKNPGDKAHMMYADIADHLEKSYRAQCVGQMLACEVDETVLLSHHPDMPEVEVVIRQDEEYAAALLGAIEKFCDLLDVKTQEFEDRGWVRATDLHPEWVEQWEREEQMRADLGGSL